MALPVNGEERNVSITSLRILSTIFHFYFALIECIKRVLFLYMLWMLRCVSYVELFREHEQEQRQLFPE